LTFQVRLYNNVLDLVTVTGPDGLDYLLTHFVGCVWPRNISTLTTDRRQILVFNEVEALARFKQANWMDCRISAYPSFTEYKGINRQAANFIFIDLDRSTFKTDKAHNLALITTLENIKQKLGGAVNPNPSPTVLCSGNGYHIYLPVNAPVLEEFDIFEKFKSPSRKLMQYAESFLSNNKADYAHNVTVSFKNCMLRVPGSINSKNGQTVKLLQLWDGYFPKINPLLADFYIYLCGQRIKELTNQSNQSNQLNRSRFGSKAYLQDDGDGHGSYYQSISRYLRFSKRR
jgi:hypothetical protein